ncbi:uncharacterized protein LY89DRAFT_687822 [Mollisia scopiformis]|uniref:Uncharacterized protein n=1 Tax=Mollisia scopiformis TaxID=149040 RepID=A0A194WY36_MOLSC|nr:uncharacterized protein LY89DRAFT_687822 [Mollisia scopiformis]KUJ12886.1 hypothetical protein LY89DRAFT_687822 [Mollisia scopiformis]
MNSQILVFVHAHVLLPCITPSSTGSRYGCTGDATGSVRIPSATNNTMWRKIWVQGSKSSIYGKLTRGGKSSLLEVWIRTGTRSPPVDRANLVPDAMTSAVRIDASKRDSPFILEASSYIRTAILSREEDQNQHRHRYELLRSSREVSGSTWTCRDPITNCWSI